MAVRVDVGDASMRPRHFCPGRPKIDAEIIDVLASFNEAEAFLPRKVVLVLGLELELEASMRPRHFCPGSAVI